MKKRKGWGRTRQEDNMSAKFVKKLRKAQTFDDWMGHLKRFNYALIKENNLQAWTVADFKNYWDQHIGGNNV